jgi:uncharacterized Zn finger protein
MKLKVACSSCSRMHLVTVVEEKVAPVMELTCLSCGSIVKYRIAVKKNTERAEEMLKKMMADYGKKSEGKAVNPFGELFGGMFGNKK